MEIHQDDRTILPRFLPGFQVPLFSLLRSRWPCFSGTSKRAFSSPL
ncbi:hypothetical protein RBSH_02334 [Rhodopirellula baltica SH28]|uniref:Uncharacterized protein n=1 Tax=Rhodopirellula baltica SH28 TaxID=993517 RepID=K5DIQ0_RHOBT|nr:hypothetical protein RBSH_02334 [Rhodopirellula baltica SH28]